MGKRIWHAVVRSLRRIFVWTVLIPTAVAVLYYGVIASDAYISESRFVIRNPQRAVATGLGALLQGTGFSRSQDDAYSVQDFFQSRDALQQLDAKMQVRKAYSDRRIDMLSRFPGLDWDDSFEAFYRYFQKQLEVDYDPASSITTLRVRAYDAQMAKQIDESMLEMGERLVNELNDRARADLVEVAEREVRTAENQVRESSAALGNLRRETRVFEPNRQSEMQLETVSRLEGELLAAQGQLDQLRRVSPSNPQIPALADRVRDLRRSAESERGKVVGGTRSYSSATSSFDRLLLDKTFAEKRLASAMEALEAARAEASRKQLYLERLAQPSLPDSSEEPRRLRGVVSVFLIGLAVWGVVTLVSATVREHVD